jgi:hypothetical protein
MIGSAHIHKIIVTAHAASRVSLLTGQSPFVLTMTPETEGRRLEGIEQMREGSAPIGKKKT